MDCEKNIFKILTTLVSEGEIQKDNADKIAISYTSLVSKYPFLNNTDSKKAYQSADQSANQSADQSANQSADQSADHIAALNNILKNRMKK